MTSSKTPVNYDPFSHEAMKDPYPLYKAMRAEGKPHFIEKYNAWAFCRFADVWEASAHESDITFSAGQTPGQVLLGEMVPHTFMTMDAPECRKWRGLIREAYTPESAMKEAPRIRKMVREILHPLLAKGEMDVYKDFANRVTTISFPGPISAIDAAGVSSDPKAPGQFQLAHTKGSSFLSVRALADKATTNLNVRWNKRTYVFELIEGDVPVLALNLDDRSAAKDSSSIAAGLIQNAKPAFFIVKPDPGVGASYRAVDFLFIFKKDDIVFPHH